MQGNRPEELPEVVLAAARVARVNFNKVRPFPARMERTQSNKLRLAPVNGSSRESTSDLSAVQEDVYCIANTRGHSEQLVPPESTPLAKVWGYLRLLFGVAVGLKKLFC